MKRIIVSFFVVAILLSQSFGLGGKPSDIQHNKAIDFTLRDISGKEIKLSNYRGKMVFLNFWATWCPPCREEMPSMQKLYERLKEQKFEMLAVSIDNQDGETVKSFVKKGGYSFPMMHDREGQIASSYKIFSIPTTFLIDKNGVIVERVVGARDWSDPSVVKKITALIKK